MTFVAGYCRVSTDRDDQANSFEAQQRYFREYIAHHPDWLLHDIYADEGISGTGTKKRQEFNRMLRDARMGKFSLILTKEVSRFSRNILDTIAFTRELKSLGVGIRFLLDGIDTMNPDAELHLSIMGSLAQEESRKTSCRVSWGQVRQMERGIVFGHSLLGYEVRNGKLSVEPEGADTVRLIFQKYTLENYSAYQVARFLMDENRKTALGRTQWTSQAVLKILRNEKYVGDLIQRKTYTPNYLTHQKKANNGNVPLIRINDHHEPIITRALWTMAQSRISQREGHGKPKESYGKHLFSGKIICGICGKCFVARYKYRSDGTKYLRWCCSTAVSQGLESCKIGKLIRDDDARQMMNTAIASLPMDHDAIIGQTVNIIQRIQKTEVRTNHADSEKLRRELQRIRCKKEAVMDSYFEKLISREDMLTMVNKYETQLCKLRDQISRMNESQNEQNPQFLDIPSIKQTILDAFSGQTENILFYRNLLHSITVFPDRHTELRFFDLDTVFHFSEDHSRGFSVEKSEYL